VQDFSLGLLGEYVTIRTAKQILIFLPKESFVIQNEYAA
jgi:hypothetical protein